MSKFKSIIAFLLITNLHLKAKEIGCDKLIIHNEIFNSYWDFEDSTLNKDITFEREMLFTWKLINDSLHLIEQNPGYYNSLKGIKKETFDKPIFQNNFNKSILVSFGKSFENSSSSLPFYEFEKKFNFKNGKLISTEFFDNSKTRVSELDKEMPRKNLQEFFDQKVIYLKKEIQIYFKEKLKNRYEKFGVGTNFSCDSTGKINIVSFYRTNKHTQFEPAVISVLKSIENWTVLYHLGKFYNLTVHQIFDFKKNYTPKIETKPKAKAKTGIDSSQTEGILTNKELKVKIFLPNKFLNISLINFFKKSDIFKEYLKFNFAEIKEAKSFIFTKENEYAYYAISKFPKNKEFEENGKMLIELTDLMIEIAIRGTDAEINESNVTISNLNFKKNISISTKNEEFYFSSYATIDQNKFIYGFFKASSIQQLQILNAQFEKSIIY
ncbi:MAG: hypothetical protein EAZ53_10820 [Bacteroidetes bacterium]|nr:MAG: hypothetical protein EAZ53_10820 [Bacteroidota bacterium]